MNKLGYLGELEQMVLIAVLRLEPDAYSVAVRTEIEARTGRRLARGAVFVTLDRMVKKGYLSSCLGEPTPERGGRAKRFFSITPQGKLALRASREAFAKLWSGFETALDER